MNHYTVTYIDNLGRTHKITVLSYSITDALGLFNDSRKLFNVREILSVEPEKIS